MLDRAGIPYTIQDIEWNQSHSTPGGTDLTIRETIGFLSMVFSFDRDGAINTLDAYDKH